MKPTLVFLTVSGLLALAGPAPAQETQAAIPIVLAKTSTSAERLAAQDLSSALQRLYPRDQFIAQDQLPESGQSILLGTGAEVKKRVGAGQLAKAESYVITTAREGRRQLGVIAGADARGVAFGVHALLEKLGCGFYLSNDAFPPARTEAFSFADWQLANQPLVHDRLVFDWHNFLSGCSTWNLVDWNRWTDQSLKMSSPMPANAGWRSSSRTMWTPVRPIRRS